jgi:uncharacterized membrane protein YoaT (DUF817 family)
MNLFLLSSIIGIVWGIVTADFWIYNRKLFNLVYVLHEGVPIIIGVTWGVTLTLSLITIELVQNKFFHRSGKTMFLMFSIITMGLVGYIIEFIGIYFGIWSYTFAENYQIWIDIVPLRVWIGWMLFGSLMLGAVKFYSNDALP